MQFVRIAMVFVVVVLLGWQALNLRDALHERAISINALGVETSRWTGQPAHPDQSTEATEHRRLELREANTRFQTRVAVIMGETAFIITATLITLRLTTQKLFRLP